MFDSDASVAVGFFCLFASRVSIGADTSTMPKWKDNDYGSLYVATYVFSAELRNEAVKPDTMFMVRGFR